MDKILSTLIINRVYHSSVIFTEAGGILERRNRPCWALLIKFEGETVYDCNGKQFLSNANNVVILPKSSSYKWRCLRPGHYAIIEFESDSICADLYSFPVKNCEQLLSLFRSIEYKRLRSEPFHEMEGIAITYAILLRLLRAGRSYLPSIKEQKLASAMDYISKHYTQKITNDTLAQIAGISTVYFRKLFREVYGVSPMEYIKDLRIKKAQEILRSDFSRITDIAMSLGYGSIYDFSRDFRKHTGVSPKQYQSKTCRE